MSDVPLSNDKKDVVVGNKVQTLPKLEFMGPGQLEAFVPARVAETVMFEEA